MQSVLSNDLPHASALRCLAVGPLTAEQIG
jgi:hypothetical protein